MDYLEILVCTIIAYLIGSIPVSVALSKLYYGIDIRNHGSGSATHTNMSRVFGNRSSLLVRIVDIIKGIMAARLAIFAHHQYGVFSIEEYPVLMMSFGLAAIIGHIFPVFADFRGGKGYHVSIGVVLAINPVASLVFVLISAVAFIISRYPHLSYVIGALALPVFVLATQSAHHDYLYIPSLIFSLTLFLILFLSHRIPLSRIFKGEEDKREFWVEKLKF